MPYLRFNTTDKQSVQLSGNNAEDFVKAFEKHGKIAHKDYAMAWVRAYFERRDLEVTLQKVRNMTFPQIRVSVWLSPQSSYILSNIHYISQAARGEVSVNEEEVENKLDAAEEAEAKFKDAYEAVCKGKKTDVAVSSSAADNKAKKSSDDYDDFYNAPTTVNEVSEDLF